MYGGERDGRKHPCIYLSMMLCPLNNVSSLPIKSKATFLNISKIENKPRQISLTIYQFSNITTQKNDYFFPQDALTTVLD